MAPALWPDRDRAPPGHPVPVSPVKRPWTDNRTDLTRQTDPAERTDRADQADRTDRATDRTGWAGEASQEKRIPKKQHILIA